MREGSSPAFVSDAERPERDPSRRGAILRLALAGCALFGVTSAAIWAGVTLSFPSSERLDSPNVHGVRLGMSGEAVRASFVDSLHGRWARTASCCGEGLEWARSPSDASKTRWARFDFRQGELVALHLAEDATGGPPARRVDVSAGSVLEVRPGADGSVKTAVLARALPAYRAEVSEILAMQAMGR